jgi:predicted RND superfamily exporter protein
MSIDYQFLIDRVDGYITGRPVTVVLVFLVLTGLFTLGLGAVESETGEEQFVEDLPSFEALEDLQEDFGPTFTDPGGEATTTLLQENGNVVSKPSMLRLLRTQRAVADAPGLRVESTDSHARAVASTLDPNATTLDAQIRALERATPTEVAAAVRETHERDPTFEDHLSTDFNPTVPAAGAAQASVTHRTSSGSDGGGGGGPTDGGGTTDRQERVGSLSTPDIRVLGSAPDTIFDSLRIVLPAAFVFIILFLGVAYRDPADLFLGIASIVMALLWTFGLLGFLGIAFNPLLVTVPPLLIAVGIDFSIHAVNRYREERVLGADIATSMKRTTDQLLVAFFIVTGTTVIGFLSNLVSAFPPIRDFGLVAAIGIVFTFLIFGVFFPSAKLLVDRLRDRYPIPQWSTTPLGAERSRLGRLLGGGATVGSRAPAVFLAVVLVLTLVAGWYAAGVGTEFDSDDFLPEEETPEELQYLPEPFRPPAEYEYVRNLNFQREHFDTDGQILMYIETPMEEGHTLRSLDRATRNRPETFRGEGWDAEAESVVTAIRRQADRDPEFARLVERNDRNGDGIPEHNLGRIYDELDEEPRQQFLTQRRASTQVIYTVNDTAPNSEVTEDARAMAERHRGDATPTGLAVVFQEASDLIFGTVIWSLALTLSGTVAFLVLIYWVIEGRPSLGVANAVPIGIAVVFVVASMRYAGVDFNAVNGTILAITVGLGIDYSVHMVHRFADERETRALEPALRRTVTGTGGALTGSMLTTVAGLGVLALALNPAIGVFGLLTALSVIYAYLVSIFVLPAVLVLWDRFRN